MGTPKIPKISKPSKQDIEASMEKFYEQCKLNTNNFSHWFPRIKNIQQLLITESYILQLNLEWFTWLLSDSYSLEKINEFSSYILDNFKQSELFTDSQLFLKSGLFSNKFDFVTCVLRDKSQIGRHFLDIFYTGLLVGADKTSELVIRELIAPTGRKTIYNGMPLNTEFRVFYDFDTKQILGIFNYWDRDTVEKSLTQKISYCSGTSKVEAEEDLANFLYEIPMIEAEFNIRKDEVSALSTLSLKDVDLKGKWSIDIMLAHGKYYLIDMALAKDSYYYEKLDSIAK